MEEQTWIRSERSEAYADATSPTGFDELARQEKYF
jgi:hypothetical protein